MYALFHNGRFIEECASKPAVWLRAISMRIVIYGGDRIILKQGYTIEKITEREYSGN